MKAALPAVFACLLAAACRGEAPIVNSGPSLGISAVIAGARVILPGGGEATAGEIDVNLESEDAEGEVYRLRLRPGRPQLLQIEPGSYRLSPVRSFFGSPRGELRVKTGSQALRAPFPRELRRESAVSVKSKRIVSLGIVVARVERALPGQEPSVSVSLDDSIQTRRHIVETVIHGMMEPDVPAAERESAIAWTNGLDRCLQDLLTQTQRAPLYKLAP
jgi:hypothetical protein